MRHLDLACLGGCFKGREKMSPEDPKQMEVMAELTPNPNTLKFNVHKQLLPFGSFNFLTKESAKESVLASRLFEVEHVASVMIGIDFVSVTKDEASEWPVIARDVVESIRYFLQSGEPAVSKSLEEKVTQGGTEMEMQIRAILDEEIRPAVARDGGDIIFYGYENGVVKLHLQGACSSCPSSVLTLKMGIENRLKQSFPEIKEVIQV
jgi:Fe-S cluster biogenesis protein NfuA